MEAGASDAEATREEELLYLLTEGSDLLRAGQVAAARQHFERALTLETGNEQALNLLGLSQFRLGEYEEATRIFEGLIHNNPVEPSLRLNLAMVHLKTERLDDAKQALETVLDLNPDHPRAASYMGLVLEKLGDNGGAAPWYERAGNPERAAQARDRAASQAGAATGDDAGDEVIPASDDGSDLDTDEPSVEIAAQPSVGSEAAALTAARVESLQRPQAPPSQDKADAARAASLGFTFDDPQGSEDDRDEAEGNDAIMVTDPAEEPGPPDTRALNDPSFEPSDAGHDDLLGDDPLGDDPLNDTALSGSLLDTDHDDLLDGVDDDDLGPPPPEVEEAVEEDAEEEAEPDDDGEAVVQASGPEPTPAAEVASEADVGEPAQAAGAAGSVQAHSTADAAAVQVAPTIDGRRQATAKLSLESLLRSTPAPPATGEAQPVGDGAIALAIQEILYLRTDRLMGLTGELEVEPINRRYRGRRTDSLFGGNDKPMSAAMGNGMALLDPGESLVCTLRMESEDLYLVEAHLLAFTDGLVWENGRLPAEDGEDLDIVHLRGTGDIILVTQRAPMCLDVRSDRPVTLHASRLIGWNGQVVPFRGPFPGLPDNAKRPPIVRFEGSGLVLCG